MVLATAVYAFLAIGTVVTVIAFAALLLRRSISPLLNATALLHTAAVLSLLVPVGLAGNKFAGAAVVFLVLPLTLLLLGAAAICFGVWLTQIIRRRLLA